MFATKAAKKDFDVLLAGRALPAQTTVAANLPAGGAATLIGWRRWNNGVITVDISEQGGG